MEQEQYYYSLSESAKNKRCVKNESCNMLCSNFHKTRWSGFFFTTLPLLLVSIISIVTPLVEIEEHTIPAFITLLIAATSFITHLAKMLSDYPAIIVDTN